MNRLGHDQMCGLSRGGSRCTCAAQDVITPPPAEIHSRPSRARVRSSHSVTVPLTHDTTWFEVKQAVADAGVPEEARPSVRKTQGDRPWESGTEALVFAWES